MKKKLLIILSIVALISAIIPTAVVQANAAGPLDHVVVTPAEIYMLVNTTQQFKVQGKDVNNKAIEDLTYSWQIVAGGGNISNTGLFTAGNVAGTYANTIKVTVTQGALSRIEYASVIIVIAPGTLDHVVITPQKATIGKGGTQQFTAQGQDVHNLPITGLTYAWSVVAGGGTISNAGLFIAGTVQDIYPDTVKVTTSQNSFTVTAKATVVVKGEKDKSNFTPPGWSKGKKTGWHGSNTPPGWTKEKHNKQNNNQDADEENDD